MSNSLHSNFYAHLNISPDVIYKLLIGTREYEANGISTFSGKHFPTVKAWVDFLTYNSSYITLVDGDGNILNLDEFIANEITPTGTSDAQIKWLTEHRYGYPINPAPPESTASWKLLYWLDAESGKLFKNGEFS